MRVLYCGESICDAATLKRLVLVAEEVGFMDRPSVSFKDWGTIGADSEIRSFDTSGAPITLSAHTPPSGPAYELYQPYCEADLGNPDFVQEVLNGLRTSDRFAWKLLQEAATYGDRTGGEIRAALASDSALDASGAGRPLEPGRMFRVDSPEDRLMALQFLVVEASIRVTSALIVSERSGLLPVADDPHMCRLLAMRSAADPYVSGTPRVSPALGIAVARSVVPDAVLAELSIGDVFDYRKKADGAYRSWSTEINRLAADIAAGDPLALQTELPRIINVEVAPRLAEYEAEMASIRDDLFAGLLKKVTTWELPTLSLSFLAGIELASALALFAASLTPAIPEVVDYFKGRRNARRGNTMAYLIGLTD